MYRLLRSALFKLDPETAHNLTFCVVENMSRVPGFLGAVSGIVSFQSDVLCQEVFGIHFANPVGLAAGMDKNARLLPLWQALGFGSVEIGSVTARPSKGNPKPRMFRLQEDRALINRMGLNNYGATQIRDKLEGLSSKIPLGINIAKTNDISIVGRAAVEDYLISLDLLRDQGDYFTLNLSCPNTEDACTFEDKTKLEELLREVAELNLVAPILIKLSPDIEEGSLCDCIDLAMRYGVKGLVLANTSNRRPAELKHSRNEIDSIGRGGLSGEPLRENVLGLVSRAYRRAEGKLAIIAVGGVGSALDAYRCVKAGASLVQLYTSLVYEGPALVGHINRGLAKLMEKDGFKSIGEAVGVEN